MYLSNPERMTKSNFPPKGPNFLNLENETFIIADSENVKILRFAINAVHKVMAER